MSRYGIFKEGRQHNCARSQFLTVKSHIDPPDATQRSLLVLYETRSIENSQLLSAAPLDPEGQQEFIAASLVFLFKHMAYFCWSTILVKSLGAEKLSSTQGGLTYS